MAWTYAGSAAMFDRDDIRELVGDTTVGDQLISDERIQKYRAGGIAAQPNRLAAAAMVCREISAELRRRANLTAGGTSVQLERQAIAYRELASEYRRQASIGSTAGPYIGGISIAARDARDQDPDRTPPAFTTRTGDANEAPPVTERWLP